MTSVQPLLEVANLSKVFPAGGGLLARGSLRAVDSVSFSMPEEPPTLLALVGESGSGKTTIARMILGLTEPTEGEILYRGRNVHRMTRRERSRYRKQVQAVFQDPYGTYNPFYRIDRVMHLAIKKFGLASSRSEAAGLVEEALKAVDLRPADVLGRYPHQLSGGERQRVMLARVYLLRPKLIVADEPVSMIDVSLRAAFLNILLGFEQEYGMSCIFITHDLATGYYLGGRIVILCQGRVVEAGLMDEVVSHPKHPYSELLISSVPPHDPGRRWQEDIVVKIQEKRRSAELEVGCIYRDRCRLAMGLCGESPPPMYEVALGHQVACYLYQ